MITASRVTFRCRCSYARQQACEAGPRCEVFWRLQCTKLADVVDLFRGMRDLKLSAGFLEEGGVEIAPMSTTTDLNVAVDYAVRGSKAASLILKLRTPSFMQRGADISFLSAFPSEKELVRAANPNTAIHQRTHSQGVLCNASVLPRVCAAALPPADPHEG
jgi:hypothetical protein